MAEGFSNPDSGNHRRVVVPLRPGPDAGRKGKPPRAKNSWLSDHVRDLVADVDAIADELSLTARRRERSSPQPALPRPVSTPAPAAVSSPPTPQRDLIKRVAAMVTPVLLPHRLVRVRVNAVRLPDPRMRIRTIAVAARGCLGWRDRLARLPVSVRDPGAALTTAEEARQAVADPIIAITAIAGPEAIAAEPEAPEPAVAVVAVAEPSVAEDTSTPVEDPALRASSATTAEPRPLVINAAATTPTDRGLVADAIGIAVSPLPATLPDRADTKKPKGFAGLRYLGELIVAAAMSISLVSCILICAAVLTGHHPEAVVTGSMVPTIPVGSMVISEKVPVDNLVAGDILVFPRPINRNITNQTDETIVHRITSITQPGDGTLNITTKGDNNTGLDCWNPPACPISRDAHALADRVVYILPGFGNAAVWLRLGAIAFVAIVLVGAVLGWGIRQIRRQLWA